MRFLERSRGFAGRVVLTGLLITGFAALTPASAAGQGACGEALRLEVNGSFRSFATDTEYFELEVPAAGVLTLDVVAPLDAPSPPKLAWFDADCRVGTDDGAVASKRRISGLTLAVPGPGLHRFGVAAQDPRFGLGRYKIVSRFVEKDVTAPGKSTEDPEGDPDPPGKSTEDPEGDPDPPGKSTLCRSRDIDDHADTFSCATPLRLGTSLEGELRSPWNDDADVFTFFLLDPQTVVIESQGETVSRGALYDARGYRLAVAGEGILDLGGFRLYKTLHPGRYYVRVEGVNASEGRFALRVATLDW